MKREINIDVFTGGLAQTNAYLLNLEGKNWLIDAPEGAADYIQDAGVRLEGLILTHGHWDHIWDGGQILKAQQCPSIGHRDDALLFKDPNVMAQFGLPVKLDPVSIERFVYEGNTYTCGALTFKILHLPGHCPGSIGLYEPDAGILFGGDVLFAGGVGRWDLPGGDFDVLMQSIKSKLLTLPDETVVYPGHGPSTTIGQEKGSNPFLKS